MFSQQPVAPEVDGGEEIFAAERAHQLWFFLFLLLAISVWGQWLGMGAFAEMSSEDGSAAILALHLLPLGVAVTALIWSHPALRLALFPTSFLPGLALLTEVEWAALKAPLTLSLALVSFGLYLVVAAGRPKPAPLTASPSRGLVPRLRDPMAPRFRHFLRLRLVVMAVLFAVITYALFLSPEVQQSLSALEPEQAAKTQHVFMTVLMYFAWMIAVYMGVLLPLLNWEHDRRQPAMPAAQRRLLQGPGRLGRRIFGWLILLALVSFATFWTVLGV